MSSHAFTKVIRKKSKKKYIDDNESDSLIQYPIKEKIDAATNNLIESRIIKYLETRTGDTGVLSHIGGALFSQVPYKFQRQYIKRVYGGIQQFLLSSRSFNLYQYRSDDFFIHDWICVMKDSNPSELVQGWPENFEKIRTLNQSRRTRTRSEVRPISAIAITDFSKIPKPKIVKAKISPPLPLKNPEKNTSECEHRNVVDINDDTMKTTMINKKSTIQIKEKLNWASQIKKFHEENVSSTKKRGWDFQKDFKTSNKIKTSLLSSSLLLNPPPGFENAWTSSRQSVVRSDNDGKQHTSIFERNIAKSDQEGKRIALAPINDLSNCKHTRKKIHHNHQQYDAINNDISIQYEKKNIIECKTNYRMDDDQDDEKKLLHEIFTTKRNKYATKGNTAVISKMKYSKCDEWKENKAQLNMVFLENLRLQLINKFGNDGMSEILLRFVLAYKDDALKIISDYLLKQR